MSSLKDQSININNHVQRKLSTFKEQSDDLEVTSEDFERLIHCLIQGDVKELGGLIALRGFIYQYYVAISYMLDMLYSSGAWWDAVIFELLDDIVLINSKKIRFVQVKTGREDSTHKIEPSTLYKRDDNINSWLDVLFLNLPNYLLKHRDVGDDDLTIGDKFTVQFEIVTNLPNTHGNYLGPYFRNGNYDLSEEDRHTKDVLLEKLQTKHIIYEGRGKKRIQVDEKSLEELLQPFKINWCLSRLYIKSLGYFSELEKEMIHKVSEILSETEELLRPSIAQYIINRLLAKVVERTHQDGPTLNKKDLIFTKKELILMFETWKKESEVLIHEATQQGFLVAKFNNCVEELQKEIERNWQGESRQSLLATLDWICLELSNRVRNGTDAFVYERFLNKLFEMKNNRMPFSLKGISESRYLINSLEYIVMCLSFYQKKEFPYDQSSLLFKHGEQEEKRNFVTYNAREREEFDVIKRRLIQVAMNCSETQSIEEDYFCILVDTKEALNSEDDLLADLMPISSVDNNNKRITEVPLNMKFIQPKKLGTFMMSFRNRSNELSFEDEPIRKIWRRIINTSKLGDEEI